MSEPTDHEVNKRLAVFMGEKRCSFWKKNDRIVSKDFWQCLYSLYSEQHYSKQCFHCDEGVPAYTESLDLVGGVEDKFDLKQRARHIKILRQNKNHFIGLAQLCKNAPLSTDETEFYNLLNLMYSTASHRARACYEVIEEKSNARTD